MLCSSSCLKEFLPSTMEVCGVFGSTEVPTKKGAECSRISFNKALLLEEKTLWDLFKQLKRPFNCVL